MKHIVKWGIIGLGNIAYEFAKSFYNVNNAQLIAVASNSKEKLLKFKENFNIKKENLYNSYDHILEDNNIDIIYIALPNSLHFEWIQKAIEKKKKILVEKPALVSLEQAKLISNHENFKDTFVSEGYMYKYHPQITEIIKILERGDIGNPYKMETNFGMNLIYKKNLLGIKKKNIDKKKRIFNKKLGGGVILDIGCYTTSLSLMIASLIKNIDTSNFKLSDIKTKYLEKDIDVHSSAKINFDERFSSNITASFVEEVGTNTIIYCENNNILIENSWITEKSKIKIQGRINKEIKFESSKNTYSLEIENISKDIINKKTEASFPGTSKKDILLNTKIIDNWINET